MIVDHNEIETLLSQAKNLAEEAQEDASTPPSAAVDPVSAVTVRPRPVINAPPDVARLLRIRVPVIVQLADRRMSIADVRKLSLGMIIEFYKGIDDPLDLLINNHLAGKGEAVKVGEHFGLRISEIRDAVTRIKSMGQ